MLFVCERCSTIDNTALAMYALQKARDIIVLCYACQNHGQWHDWFPRIRYDRGVHGPIRIDRTLERGTL